MRRRSSHSSSNPPSQSDSGTRPGRGGWPQFILEGKARMVELLSKVAEIDAALERVRSSADRVLGGDASFKEQTYEDIFALNNAIGRLARE